MLHLHTINTFPVHSRMCDTTLTFSKSISTPTRRAGDFHLYDVQQGMSGGANLSSITADGFVIATPGVATAEENWAALMRYENSMVELEFYDEAAIDPWHATARMTATQSRYVARYSAHPYIPIRLRLDLTPRAYLYGLSVGDSATLTSTTTVKSLTSTGNTNYLDAVYTVTAGSANLTNVKLTTYYALQHYDGVVYKESSHQYAGTITSGNSLVIDCAALTVKNNGTDDIDNWTRLSTDEITPWLPLNWAAPSLTVVRTGGSTNSTVQILHRSAQAL